MMPPAFYPGLLLRHLMPAVVSCCLIIIGLEPAALRASETAPINFSTDVQPIFEKLSTEDQDTLMTWLEQGGELPESFSPHAQADAMKVSTRIWLIDTAA